MVRHVQRIWSPVDCVRKGKTSDGIAARGRFLETMIMKTKEKSTAPVGDRRHFSRVPFQHEVTLTGSSGRTYPGAFNDISLKGMLFYSDPPPQVKETLRGSLPLGDDVLEIRGEVVRVFDQRAAIRFLEMDVESFSHLRRLVTLNMGDAERIDQEFFDSL